LKLINHAAGERLADGLRKLLRNGGQLDAATQAISVFALAHLLEA